MESLRLDATAIYLPSFQHPDRPSDDTVALNDRCLLRTRDGHRIVLVAGILVAQYTVGDAMAEAHAMVSLIEQGWADQVEVARAFGCSTRPVRRYQRRFEEGGLAALGRPGGYSAGRPRLDGSRTRLVNQLRANGKSLREIADRVGVSDKAVRKQLRRLGWQPTAEQLPLPMDPAPAADLNLSGPVAPPLKLRDVLRQRLEDKGRTSWFYEETAFYESPSSYVVEEGEVWRKIPRARSLSGAELAVLRELGVWREETAQELDENRTRIIRDDLLVEIARRKPRRVEDLKELRGLHSAIIARHGKAIVNAVAAGMLACSWLQATTQRWPAQAARARQ